MMGIMPKKNSEGHGKDHGEQAREGARQSRSATPGMQLQTVQAPSSRGSCEKEAMQDGARRTVVRSVDREALALPDWLVRQYWREAGIQTAQDYQY
jgi:hypothetical protein